MEEKLFDGDFFRSLKRISLWSEIAEMEAEAAAENLLPKAAVWNFLIFESICRETIYVVLTGTPMEEVKNYLSSFSCRNRKECTLSF